MNNWIRCALLLVVEATYIGFTAFLLRNPVPLPHILTLFSTSTIQSAIGSAIITWQSLAKLLVFGIIDDVRSREWRVKLPESEHVSRIQKTDIFNHWPYSSKTFKYAFFVPLLWIFAFFTTTNTIISANLEGPIVIGGLIRGTSDMSRSVLRLEQLWGLNLGYVLPQPTWIIPKPAYNVSWYGGSIDYSSDVVAFGHTCNWSVPLFNATTFGEVTIGDEVFDFSKFGVSLNSTTIPGETTVGTGVFSVPHLQPTRSTSAFLVFGGNTSFPLNSDLSSADTAQPGIPVRRALANTIDLTGLPTVHDPSLYHFSTSRFTQSNGNRLVFRAPLATALLCDAHPVLGAGQVSLGANSLSVVRFDSSARMGNIASSDLPSYFSYAIDAVNDPGERIMSVSSGADQVLESQPPLLVEFTPLAARLLLPETTTEWSNASLSPVSLDQIAKNMDAFVSSVSKAQRIEGEDGYTEADLLGGSGTREVTATIHNSQILLGSNLVFFCLATCFAFSLFVLCGLIAARVETDRQPPFDLKHVKEHYRSTEKNEGGGGEGAGAGGGEQEKM